MFEYHHKGDMLAHVGPCWPHFRYDWMGPIPPDATQRSGIIWDHHRPLSVSVWHGKQDRRESRLAFMAQTATVVGVVTLLYTLTVDTEFFEVCLYLEYEGQSMEIEILQWRISLQSNKIDRSMPHLCTAFLMLALTSSEAHVCMFGCKAAAAVCSSFRKMGVQELIGSRRIHDLSLDVNDSFQLCSTMFNYVQLYSKGETSQAESELSPEPQNIPKCSADSLATWALPDIDALATAHNVGMYINIYRII